MNYYIQGDADKADQIKAAFEKLGYDTAGWNYKSDRGIYFTNESDKSVEHTSNENFDNLIKTHPDCKELKLPVEPKFKVGSWIACDADSFTLSIKSVKDGNYYFHQGASLPIKDIDEHYHLWTIADAKNGDVLAADECYVIFKEIDWLNIKCYCTYHYMGFNPSFHIDTLQNKAAFNPATKEQRDTLFAKMKEYGYEWDEKKKELHKIINPKFKVGDWVVSNGQPAIIYELKQNYYLGKYLNGHDFCHKYADEDKLHLWTIQDAKDGDVLSYQGEVFITRIARGLSANVAIDYDCCYDGNSFILDSFYSLTMDELKEVYPATKQQRDLLFAKMKEAGYKWDADKKELKKIPKPHYDISNFKPFDHCRFKPTETHDWIYADFWYIQAHYKVEHLSAIEKWES